VWRLIHKWPERLVSPFTIHARIVRRCRLWTWLWTSSHRARRCLSAMLAAGQCDRLSAPLRPHFHKRADEIQDRKRNYNYEHDNNEPRRKMVGAAQQRLNACPSLRMPGHYCTPLWRAPPRTCRPGSSTRPRNDTDLSFQAKRSEMSTICASFRPRCPGIVRARHAPGSPTESAQSPRTPDGRREPPWLKPRAERRSSSSLPVFSGRRTGTTCRRGFPARSASRGLRHPPGGVRSAIPRVHDRFAPASAASAARNNAAAARSARA
jgi:hypothetical protein